jgi:hypothetical protein
VTAVAPAVTLAKVKVIAAASGMSAELVDALVSSAKAAAVAEMRPAILKAIEDGILQALSEERAAVRSGAVVWRVQWYSRRQVGEPDRVEGVRDFTDEAEARAHLVSDDVRTGCSPYWRVELQCCGPWVTVEAGTYTEEG